MDVADTGGTGSLNRTQRNWDYHIIRDYVATTGNTDISTMPPNVRYAIGGIDPKIWKGFVAEGKEMAAKKAAMMPSADRPVSPDVKPLGTGTPPGSAPAMNRPGQMNAEGVQILPGRRVGYPGPVQPPQQSGGASFDFSQFSPAKPGMDNAPASTVSPPASTVSPSAVASAQAAATAGYDEQAAGLSGGNEDTGGYTLNKPPVDEKLRKAYSSLEPQSLADVFLGLVGNAMDIYGSGLAAHAGIKSPTRLQQDFAMRLESQRAANQAYAFADAEISKLEPTLQKEIKAAIAQGRIDVAKELAIKAGNYPLEKALIELENKILYTNSQTSMRAIADPKAAGREWVAGVPGAPTGGG